MWTWSLNWGEITPYIVVGSCPMTPGDIIRIREETGVSALFSLQHDECLAYWKIDAKAMCHAAKKLKLATMRCPIRDFDVPDMRRNLPRAISTLAHLLRSGHRTYVHCTAGLGRSPLTVLGYLILMENVHKDEAIRLILRGRPDAVPAWEALYGACDDLENLYREDISMRAYELYETGVNQDPLMDWTKAKFAVFKKELIKYVVDQTV
ncbi:hypothetical protein D3OALGA1CA_1871 [Olavius algarvensis associated proteobacterium Delta 3]|nr:hypothetical protein D3OALGA1CA_1871 [Olavius algarvensis associated proteobacterium Delta 3]CAB5135320.1 hypothetical protein D3OALGB2SA_3892 [Olavius algarvensis associated proteobacterium Delta 3]